MFIEGDRSIVFGVDDVRKNRRIAARGPRRRIHDQGGAEASTLETLIDGKTTDEAGGQQGIARRRVASSGDNAVRGRPLAAKV